MEAARVATTSGRTLPGHDPSWQGLYRAGGISGLLAGTLYVIAMVLIFASSTPPTSGGAATLEYIAANRALYILKQALWLGPSVLAVVVFLSLYPALERVNKSYAAIGAVLGIVSWALSLAWLYTGEGAPALVYLSDQYAAATSDAQRAAFATAAETLVALGHIPAPPGILQPVGIFLLSLVMVGGTFPRSVAYFGVATGALGMVSEALLPILGAAYALYGVLVVAWFFVIGWQLYRLSLRHTRARQGPLRRADGSQRERPEKQPEAGVSMKALRAKGRG